MLPLYYMANPGSSIEQEMATNATSLIALPERAFSAPVAGREQPVTQSEIVPGHGKADTNAALGIDTQVQAMRWLRTRTRAIEQMKQQDNVRLSHTDQLILNYKDSLLSGTLTKDKLAVLYHGINDSVIQHGAVLGRIQREKTGELTLQADHILLGRQTKEPGSPFEKAGFSAESEYIKALGLDQMTDSVAKKGLVELYMLRQNIEKALFGGMVDTTLLREAGTSLHPLDYLSTNGNIFHDKIVEHIGTVLTRRGETMTNGVARTYEEIFHTDPGKAIEILRQANELALIDNSTELAKGFLSRTSDASLSTNIENHAAKATKAPTTDEILAIEVKITPLTTEITRLKDKIDELNAKVHTAEDAEENARLELEQANENYTNYETHGFDEPRNHGEIDALQKLIDDIDKIPEKDRKDLLVAYRKGIDDRRASANAFKDKLQVLNQVVKDKSRAYELKKRETVRITFEANGQKADKTKTPPIEKVEGRLEPITAELKQKAAELKKIQKELKDKRAEKEGAEKGEGAEKAKALREWKSLNDNPAKQNEIISEIVTGNLSTYSIDKLTDTTERAPGQIEGIERMRELIFKTLNNERYDPDRARKMLPDEAIAKAMTWVFKLDTQKEYAPGPPPIKIETFMNTLQTFRVELKTLEADLKTLEGATPRVEADIIAKKSEIATKQGEINDKGTDFGKTLLPELKTRTRFERGELFRFVIDQGIQSAAEHGNPLLNLNDFDARIRLMKTEVFAKEGEIFDEKRFGHTKITEESIAWEDTVTQTGVSRTGTDLDLTYKISFKNGEKGQIEHEIAIKTDQPFLDRLPLSIAVSTPPWMTDEMTRLFYKDNNLRTEYQHENAWWRVWKLRNPEIKTPAYATLDEVQSSNSAMALIDINGDIPTSGDRIPKSVGFTAFYELSPEQRLARLRGMDSQLINISLAAPTDTDGIKLTPYINPDYSVEFDASGEFYIHQGADKKRWDIFFKDVQAGYSGALLQSGHTERQDVQDFLMPLLDRVGRAAINAKRYHP